MKKVILSVLTIGVVLASCSEAVEDGTNVKEVNEEVAVVQEELEEVAAGYDYHGIKELTAVGAVSVEEMKSDVASSGAFEGKIAAKLTGVCKKAGCWVTIEDGESDIRVMFGDHDFFVPVDTDEASEVVLEGRAIVDTVSVDLQKHFLDDAVEAGEVVSQEQYDAITEDLVDISFVASGILLKK